MFECIQSFRYLQKSTIRALVLKLYKNMYNEGYDILKFKEISHYSYYIFSGSVSVYIVNPETDQKYHFQTLKPGSSFNLVTSIFNNYCIFQYTADVDCIIYLLHIDDLESTVKKVSELKNVFDKIKTKHKIDSNKYDFVYNDRPYEVDREAPSPRSSDSGSVKPNRAVLRPQHKNTRKRANVISLTNLNNIDESPPGGKLFLKITVVVYRWSKLYAARF
jgi:hypothetical protein